MKLLLISVASEESKGGIAIWTKMFLSRCAKHGIDCRLVNTVAVGKRKVLGNVRRNLLDESIRTIRIFNDLRKSIKNNEFDVVHLNTSCGTFGLFRDYIIAKQVKAKKLKLVVHFHCDIPYWINNVVSRKCLKKLLGISDERLVLCENSRFYLESQFGIASLKVPNFIDDTVILQKEKNISENISKAFFVGRVEEAKGAKEMYELAKRFPKIRFRLAGVVSDAVMLWDKPENIELIGPKSHDEVLNEMDNADVFVFLSHSEGFSLALTEAMARGLPCIATDVGAARDMLENKGGVIVSAGNVDEAIIAMNSMRDANKRREMSLWNLEKAKACYAASAAMRKIVEFYK